VFTQSYQSRCGVIEIPLSLSAGEGLEGVLGELQVAAMALDIIPILADSTDIKRTTTSEIIIAFFILSSPRSPCYSS
jgi:hypothetical protein